MHRLRIPTLVLLALAIGYWSGFRSGAGDPANDQAGSASAGDSVPAGEAAALLPASAGGRAAVDRVRGDSAEITGAIANGTSAPVPESASSPGDLRARQEQLRSELADYRRAIAAIESELIGLSLIGEPIISPIVLPPEFDWISENSYRGLFHERMQREPIDPAWAAATEARLQQFVYSRPEIVTRYGPPNIRCHSTQCEVTFLARGVDGSAASLDARALFDGSHEATAGLFECGPGECWADSNGQNGVVTIFWGMTRKEKELQSLAIATVARE